ncbi:MAG: class I SAM-dependent methyltransferase [Alphaproteobacteria bacterium]|nr:class I SAM-dependent methyltransferase [Alphaproteobacteria bacterium]
MAEGWRGYEGSQAAELAARYEALDPQAIHSGLIDLLPARPGTILDVGAGSGRDAAWLATLGHDVVAVEPSPDMLAEARRRHPDARVRWVGRAGDEGSSHAGPMPRRPPVSRRGLPARLRRDTGSDPSMAGAGPL